MWFSKWVLFHPSLLFCKDKAMRVDVNWQKQKLPFKAIMSYLTDVSVK